MPSKYIHTHTHTHTHTRALQCTARTCWPLFHHCPITAPLQSNYCPTTVPLLSHYCPLLSQYCPYTVPLLSHHCPTTAPLQSHYCPTTVPLLSTTVPLPSQYCPYTVPLLSHYCPTTLPLLPSPRTALRIRPNNYDALHSIQLLFALTTSSFPRGLHIITQHDILSIKLLMSFLNLKVGI